MEENPVRCIPRDVSVLEDNEELIQSGIWARQKEAFGWSARAFEVSPADSGDEKNARAHAPVYILVLIRSLPAGLKLAYIPYAPDLNHITTLQQSLEDRNIHSSPADLLESIGQAVRRHIPSLFCVRFDLNWGVNPGFPGFLAGRSLTPDSSSDASSASVSSAEQAPVFSRPAQWDYPEISWLNTGLDNSALKKSLADIQPPDTVILPIGTEAGTSAPLAENTQPNKEQGTQPDTRSDEQGEQELLSGMKSKTRYNIRLAGKKGVIIRRVDRSDYSVPAELEKWYELYRITEERNRIGVHGCDYYAGCSSAPGTINASFIWRNMKTTFLRELSSPGKGILHGTCTGPVQM
ncbi:peptidoglycan bridge formation glycyltransferase FemA/FemB family protein [Salinispira pacifica]|uniref:peptidoglycan bridge formation glycyltransferase FemA/FemB family protein n=1 Tax=Salinispira pacifica TaxID=1307761 RepID=UPI0004279B7A|nr:peptidoglycan bridge formation glycyltransferase FemA/FemB family protein [Salinispira pacifica]